MAMANGSEVGLALEMALPMQLNVRLKAMSGHWRFDELHWMMMPTSWK
jgi:hypothetical protein